MPTRALPVRALPRRALLVVLLASLTSACDLTVRIATTVSADGSGEFSIAMHLDDELVAALEQSRRASREGADVSALERLYGRLASQGWTTSRTEPGGGLLFEARRSFRDSADFDRVLAELRGTESPQGQPLDLGGLDVDYEVERGLLRSAARFSGSIDLSFGDDVDPLIVQLEDVLADAVHFEIRARLPGSVTVREGDGVVEEQDVVWRPRIGSATRFLAESSRLRSGSLLAILVPALILLALLAWFLTGRRRHPPALDDVAAEPPVGVGSD